MEAKSFLVKGMHCASCASVISRKIKKLSGVESCEVNYANEKAEIKYDSSKISVEEMNKSVEPLGYGIESVEDMHSHHDMNLASEQVVGLNNDHSEHTGIGQSKIAKLEELERLRNKVYFVFPISLLVFVLMMWDTLSQFFNNIPNLPIPMQLMNTILFVLASIVLFWIGNQYLRAVVTMIKYRVVNMDSLVGVGTLVAYIYSSLLLLFPFLGARLNLPEHTYFDVTIVVIGFIVLGKYLETKSKLKTGEAIEKLLNLQAKSARVLRNNIEVMVDISEVKVGDVVVVKPGEKIPIDGVVVDGVSTVDESMVSGESMPVDKNKGANVYGATINSQGVLYIKTTKVGSETMLSRIVHLVEQAQGSRAKIQNLVDRVSEIFIPLVIVVAVLAFITWIAVGYFYLGLSVGFSFGLLAFVGVLVIACPCALGLATPTAIIVGVGRGAELGILIKNADSLDRLRKVDTLVFDKTGTITNGKPRVTEIISLDTKYSQDDLLLLAASVENGSSHPLGKAIVDYAKEFKLKLEKVVNFKERVGEGVEGHIGKRKIEVVKPDLNKKNLDAIDKIQTEGKTVVLIVVDGKEVGLIAIGDTLRKGVEETVDKIKRMGIKTVLLTGDNEKAARYIAEKVGIVDVRYEVVPQEKEKIIRELKQGGRVVGMVGDGINDAPALSRADVGIAMATGTDIAIEAADITLLSGDINKVLLAIKLAKQTVLTIKQNLFWAFIYNVIGIPIAAGLIYPIFGVMLSPVYAGMAMALSSVSVVSNSLRLKYFKV